MPVTRGQAYLLLFVVAFLAVAIWETLSPKRANAVSTGRRWTNHALLYAVSALCETAMVRLLPIGAAALVQGSPVGLLNRPAIPFTVRCILTIVVLDFLQYWLHRAYHAGRPLWRVHEIHHSDPDYDVSTAARFHPLEILPIQAIRLAAVLILAPPPIAVAVSELLALLLNFVSHANASFPHQAESLLRAVFITPDLHRIHHSESPADYNRNFGQTFSCWDRLFGTYLAASSATTLVTGVRGLDPNNHIKAVSLLTRPFERNRID